jgi:osmotically-inducible protein OsmY
VVTLKGTTASEADDGEAESIAKSIASSQVIVNEIAVRPSGKENTAKTVDSDTDKGIEKSLEAASAKNKLKKEVKYDVKNGVITLTGSVRSNSQRQEAGNIASAVPNVKQVVNELQVKNETATAKRTSRKPSQKYLKF